MDRLDVYLAIIVLGSVSTMVPALDIQTILVLNARDTRK